MLHRTEGNDIGMFEPVFCFEKRHGGDRRTNQSTAHNVEKVLIWSKKIDHQWPLSPTDLGQSCLKPVYCI